MEFLYFVIAVAVVYVGFYIYGHYFNLSGKQKTVSDPFFLPENLLKYYNACKEILSPYLGIEPCREILEDSKSELKQIYHQYKTIIKENWDKNTYKYYIDVCENNNYEWYTNWAILFIRLKIEYKRLPIAPNSFEVQAFDNFKDNIKSHYQKIVDNETDCPDSFKDYFIRF
jgi:hypothetical protein